jgi:hypothetical protein
VPRALRKAVEGRNSIRLGVPPTSHVGDVVATLLTLYPQLARHVSDDRNPASPGLQLFLGDRALHDIGAVLKEGARLYLFALAPKRLSATARG